MINNIDYNDEIKVCDYLQTDSLYNEDLGNILSRRVLDSLIKGNNIFLDFRNYEIITPSFISSFLYDIIILGKINKENLKERIKFDNLSSYSRYTIKCVLKQL